MIHSRASAKPKAVVCRCLCNGNALCWYTPFVTCKNGFTNPLFSWKRLKGKNPEGKTFQRLLRRKQSSTKISKMSRNYLRSSQSDIFHLLRNLLEYLLQTFFLPRSFQMYLTFAFLAFGSFRFSLFVQSFLPRGRFW